MPLDLYNTHLNSRRASRTSPERNLAAHQRQSLEAAAFLAETNDAGHAVILGGDFNMRRSPERWASFSGDVPLELVHRVCANPRSGCEVRVSWDGDAPWMDTQDLQFFAGGDRVTIRPVRVEAMSDGTPGSSRLSDHDGFLVTYDLSWRERKAR